MKSFPFDSEVTYDSLSGMPNYDRAADSQELRAFYHLLYSDGVFPNPSTGLQVTEYSQDMSVLVHPGNAVIQGALAIEENDRILVFEASGNVYDRIDAVVARLNTNYEYRKVDLYIIKGIESANPISPELTREGGIYELRLANVFIAKNTTVISAERITDTRLNTEDCGIVTCNPNKVDTSALFTQYQTALNKFLGYVEGCIDGTEAGELRRQIADLNEHVGDTDLSTIGDGTVTGAISELNTGLENLSVLKREVMASYGYFGIEWDIDELMVLVRANQWDKFAIGDYFIETTTTGEKIQWEVAGKNPYLPRDKASKIPNIVCCPRDCLETYYKYNVTNTNGGGYAGSLMPANLETEANKFSSKLQGYMTTITSLENNKGKWARANRRIFLPGNPELVGFHGWADMYDGGASNQLPLFVGGNAHLLKGAGFNKSKAVQTWYWTADPSAADTINFCIFGSNVDITHASNNGCVAPLIVLS